MTPADFFDRLMGYLHDNGFVTLTMKDLSYDNTSNTNLLMILTVQPIQKVEQACIVHCQYC